MILVPMEKPVIEELNSYYLKIDRLLEHFRGAIESGSIYFYSPTAEAAIFFDDQSVLNAFYQDRTRRLRGQPAADTILQAAQGNNFSVSVYRIRPDRIYYWANLPDSKPLYSDLSSEFADLAGLVKKMENEKLTGYIKVDLKGGSGGGGLLFYYNGEMIGGAPASGKARIDRSREFCERLVQNCNENGGVINVLKTDLGGRGSAEQITAPGGSWPPAEGKEAPAESRRKPADQQRVLDMLQDLLLVLEKAVRSGRKQKIDFETTLNRKFMQKVDKYDFLDPFAAEFKYSGGRLSFSGDAPQQHLVEGVVECVRELVSELGVEKRFNRELTSWQKRYIDEVAAFGIEIQSG